MDTARIAELLKPFVGEGELASVLLDQLQAYLELLLRWNARINLTAVRAPEHIVTRHFGESLFAGRVLLADDPADAGADASSSNPSSSSIRSLADVGSGAGFPGIPIKLMAPGLELTLIESQGKKASFLREVLRTLGVEHADVFSGRAEEWNQAADLVTLRAVEKFERALPVAARLVAPGGRLGLLLGTAQADAAKKLLAGDWRWRAPVRVPQSEGRVICVAERTSAKVD